MSLPRPLSREQIEFLETMKLHILERTDEVNAEKLKHCSYRVIKRIFEASIIMNPESIFINAGSEEDIQYIKEQSIKKGEEIPLAKPGHTMHFDGPNDQGRDIENTKYLADSDTEISSLQEKEDRRVGLTEVQGLMKKSMEGKEMIVTFISRGPEGSKVSDPILDITDSNYVVHSNDILYRLISPEAFSRQVAEKGYFFTNFHSAGELDENNNSKNLEDRRIYIDLKKLTIWSINNQYAGSSIGSKKNDHRLDNWRCLTEYFGERLAEHMFITGMEINGQKMYFTGAYPSGCGKTGTAMTGDLVGDDLAKFFIDEETGEVRVVNPESGMFGIIKGVNSKDDPEIFEAFEEEDVIFSNLLIVDGKAYWIDMGEEIPQEGVNYSGKWKAESGDPHAHDNGRFALKLETLPNYDKKAEDPNGVKVDMMLFGGRDAKVMPPIVMAHDWMNTVVHGAIIRSQATSTEMGAKGEKRSPYANEAFFPGSLGKYVQHYKAFGENKKIAKENLPTGFQVNYWLQKSSRMDLAEGEKDGLIGSKEDTKVWMHMMGLMRQGVVDTIKTPIGSIPKYDDLKRLFWELNGKEYTKETYEMQFSLYTKDIIAHIDKSIEEFKNEEDMPDEFFETLLTWKRGLLALKSTVNKENKVTPDQLEDYLSYISSPELNNSETVMQDL